MDEVGGAGPTPPNASGGEAEHLDGVIMVTAWTSVSVVDIGRHPAGSDDLQGALPKVAAHKSEISDKMFCICFLQKVEHVACP